MSAGHDWQGAGEAREVRASDPWPASLAECSRCGLVAAHVEQWDGSKCLRASGYGLHVEALALRGAPPPCELLRGPA